MKKLDIHLSSDYVENMKKKVPIKFMGWHVLNLLHHGKYRYWILAKWCNGKMHRIHIGSKFDETKARFKVLRKEQELGIRFDDKEQVFIFRQNHTPENHTSFAFFNCASVIPDAMLFFSRRYKIPVIENPEELQNYETVFFSVYSSRDFYNIARVAKYKGNREWIAGGNAVTNPTPLTWIMDYIFIGDCFYSFEKILKGERQIPGMYNCRYPHPIKFNEEKIYPHRIYKSRLLLSVGCKRACKFCVNPFRRSYQEQEPDIVERFIKNYPGKGVYLASNSSDDVSYYQDIIRWLREYGKTDMGVSNSIYGITDEFLQTKRYQILIGIEGFSERLRRKAGKVISRDLLYEKLERAFYYKRQVKTVYQFNLFDETASDFEEFLEDVEYLRRSCKSGSWNFSFIPHQPSPFTPFQWNKPYYSPDTYLNLKEFYKYCNSMKTGLQLFTPYPLGALKWFKQIIADWLPMTPEICHILEKLPNTEDIKEYIDIMQENNIKVDYIFEEKPDTFTFPWHYVQVKTDNQTLKKYNI